MFDTRAETVFSLLRRPETAAPRSQWLWLAVLTASSWFGAVAFIGMFRQHQVARLLFAVAPGWTWYWGALAVAGLVVLYGFLRGRHALGAASLVVLAFLLGHLLYGYLQRWLPEWRMPLGGIGDAARFAVLRLAYALALLILMLPAAMLAVRRARTPVRLALGWGDWSVEARDVIAKEAPEPWARKLLTGYMLFCLILFVVMQANVGFRPLISGTLWPLVPAILVAALGNALAEEVIFRGLIQPSFIAAGGVAAGLWMQGLLFGLMHWGLSVGILAALPVSLLIGLGSVIWGKAALETRGLGWVVAAHFLVDVCVMAAFFVPRA